MGYYLHLILGNESGTKNNETLIHEFSTYGCTRIYDESAPNNFTDLLYTISGIGPLIISFISDDNKSAENYFAFIRISGAISRQQSETILVDLLDMAQNILFKIFDPQLDCFLSYENIDQVVNSIASFKVKINNLLGKLTSEKDYDLD